MVSMIILLHILIAIGSMGYTTYLYIEPAKANFNISYGLVTATLLSGSYLVASSGKDILQSCIMGLVYLGMVSFGILAAKRKLASQKADQFSRISRY